MTPKHKNKHNLHNVLVNNLLNAKKKDIYRKYEVIRNKIGNN